MKNTSLVIAVTLFLLCEVTSQTVVHDDFNYPPSDSLENMGQWYRTGLNTVYNIKVVAPGLEYAGYAGSGLGNACQLANSGQGDVLYKNLSSPITSGAAYLAFMVRVDDLPGTVTNGYCIAFNPNTGGTNLNTSLHVKRLSNTTFDLGVQKEIGNSIVYSNLVFNTAKTYLVVLKYAMINGTGNDISSLYVFENGVPVSEPNSSIASTTAGADYTGQGSVQLVNNYAQTGLTGCDIKIDGIRVGNSWATSVLSTGISGVHENAANNIQNQAFPNPFSQATTIKFQLPQKGLVSIRIHDAAGVCCTELFNNILEAGTHEFDWNGTGFPAGNYTCTIWYDGIVFSSTLLKI